MFVKAVEERLKARKISANRPNYNEKCSYFSIVMVAGQTATKRMKTKKAPTAIAVGA